MRKSRWYAWIGVWLLLLSACALTPTSPSPPSSSEPPSAVKEKEDEYALTYDEFFAKERYISIAERKEFESVFSSAAKVGEACSDFLYYVAESPLEGGLYIDPPCVFEQAIFSNGRYEDQEWVLTQSGEVYRIDPETYEMTLIYTLSGTPTYFLVHGPLLFVTTDDMLYRMYLPDLPKATVDVLYERAAGDEKYVNSWMQVFSSTDVMLSQRDTTIPNSGILGTGDGFTYRQIVVSDLTDVVYPFPLVELFVLRSQMTEYEQARADDIERLQIDPSVLCDDPDRYENILDPQ